MPILCAAASCVRQFFFLASASPQSLMDVTPSVVLLVAIWYNPHTERGDSIVNDFKNADYMKLKPVDPAGFEN